MTKFSIRDVKRIPENWISVLETKSGFTPLANEIRIYLFFSFSSRKLHKITWCQAKL